MSTGGCQIAAKVDMEGADAGGTNNGQVLVGSPVVVFQERQHARRSVAAVQAALDSIGESDNEVDDAALQADVKRVQDRGGLVAKSLEKVACNERLWDKFLKAKPLKKGVSFPPVVRIFNTGYIVYMCFTLY